MKITIEGTEQEIKNILSTIGSSQEENKSNIYEIVQGKRNSCVEERLAAVNKLFNSYQEDV
jgi:hypothetical protein